MKAQQEYESLTERIEAQKEKKLNRWRNLKHNG